MSPSPDPATRDDESASTLVLVSALFFLSGSAGLVYQVLWMRSLGLFFGSDMYGISIILGTFMGGLATGSVVGGRLSERTSRPLLLYGVAELGVGGVALAFSAVLASFDPLLQSVYPEAPASGSVGYQTARVLFAVAALLVPTTLMGATLPLIMRHFVRARSRLGESAAHFYAINTVGAMAGTLAAGFVLLPYLGMWRSTAVAAAINLAIGVVCVVLGWPRRVPLPPDPASDTELDPLPGLALDTRRRIAGAALIAFGVSGFASFALEVAWTRVLLISFSATVYSFTTTLACFLFGIFLGSRVISQVVDRHEDPLRLFALLELGIGLSVGVLGLLLPIVPDLFGRLLGVVAGLLPDPQHALVATTLLSSFPLLVVPATLLGATFPVALRIYTTNIIRVGSRTGNIYGSNTLGAVAGSLFGGLVLIPTIGATATIALIAVLFASVGAFLASQRGATGERTLSLGSAAPLAGATLACAIFVWLLPYRVTLNFNQKIFEDAELLYHAEDIQNTIDVVRSPSGATSLVIGGNVEADNGPRQRRHFVLKGHLPLLLMPEPRSVLVVGLGMGITLQATARHPGLERILVIELSPGILEAQTQLADVNGNVAQNPLVEVRIDDGRLFMKLSRERFDMITADPIHPKISRVGYLYTREYYESIRQRLAEGGVVCQWMPIYQIAPRRLRSAVRSFLEVFPHATLWYVEGHTLLVARTDDEPIDYALLARKFAHPQVSEDLASIGIDSPAALLSHLMMGPDEIRAFIADEPDVPLNTDDHPYLEYFVPGDLFFTTEDNVAALSKHLADPARLVRNLPRDAAVRLADLAARRKASLLSRER